MNISAISTVGATGYNLGHLETNNVPQALRTAVTHMTNNKQIMFDWGAHTLFVCEVRFAIEDGEILKEKDGSPLDKTDWTNCDPDELHEALESVFSGEWGPTSVDTILRLEMSGIKVFLCGNPEYLPRDPVGFIKDIRCQAGIES